jgi:hypothetical protein
MAIYRLLKFSAFEPELIASMTAAYEKALCVLQLADRQDQITELVAKKIIEVAQLGETDPERISILALEGLGIAPQSEEAAKAMQQRIRERAYEIWEELGRPEGRADQHWLKAESEILINLHTSHRRN